uniref:Uncharacterized protein n=1 Tax=Lepeophtheirus salmonis TaxID=72036 RepID=A0A0K2VEM9_LEPSM
MYWNRNLVASSDVNYFFNLLRIASTLKAFEELGVVPMTQSTSVILSFPLLLELYYWRYFRTAIQ